MKHTSSGFYKSLLAFLSSIATKSVFFLMPIMLGCSKFEQKPTDIYQIPWPTEQGGYSLQKVPIKSMEQPESLKGKFVSLLVNPFVRDGVLQSAKPVGRFIRTEDGVMVPSDYVSHQAAVVHAHFERLHQIDENLGIADKVPWPAKIGIEANVVDSEGKIEDNAIFEKGINALLFVPYKRGELPIALNGGVIAHEHFHRIYQALVLDHLKTESPEGAPSGLHSHQERCQWGKEEHKGTSLRLVQENSSEDSAKDSLQNSPADSAENSQAKASGQSILVPPPPEVNEFPGGNPLGSPFFAQGFSQDPGSRVTPEVFNTVLLRAMNEGIADFWGWMYTGHSSFVAKSISSEKQRTLEEPGGRLPSAGTIRSCLWIAVQDTVVSEGTRVRTSYRLGTEYARMLRELTLEATSKKGIDAQARTEISKKLIEALIEFREEAKQVQEKGEYISPNALLLALQTKLAAKANSSCRILQKMAALEDSAQGRSSGQNPIICEGDNPNARENVMSLWSCVP